MMSMTCMMSSDCMMSSTCTITPELVYKSRMFVYSIM